MYHILCLYVENNVLCRNKVLLKWKLNSINMMWKYKVLHQTKTPLIRLMINGTTYIEKNTTNIAVHYVKHSHQPWKHSRHARRIFMIMQAGDNDNNAVSIACKEDFRTENDGKVGCAPPHHNWWRISHRWSMTSAILISFGNVFHLMTHFWIRDACCCCLKKLDALFLTQIVYMVAWITIIDEIIFFSYSGTSCVGN